MPEVSEPEVTEPDAVMTQEVEPEAVVPDVVDVATGVSANAAVIGDAGAAAEIEDDPDAVSDAAVAVVTETVTAEETRSSDEEFSAPKKKPAASDDSERNRDIARILGALAAGVVIGSLLDDNSEVVGDTGDRLIVQRDGQYHVLKDENLLLRQPGSDLRTEAFTDGSTRTVVTRQDGIRVVTIRDGNGARSGAPVFCRTGANMCCLTRPSIAIRASPSPTCRPRAAVVSIAITVWPGTTNLLQRCVTRPG